MDACYFCGEPAEDECETCGKLFCKSDGNKKDHLCTDCKSEESGDDELFED